MFAREVHHLCHFGFGNLVGKYPTFADTVMMNMQHDAGRFLPVFLEEVLHNMNDEFHRRVIVVQQQHTIEIWPLRDRFRAGNDNGSGVTTVIV